MFAVCFGCFFVGCFWLLLVFEVCFVLDCCYRGLFDLDCLVLIALFALRLFFSLCFGVCLLCSVCVYGFWVLC